MKTKNSALLEQLQILIKTEPLSLNLHVTDIYRTSHSSGLVQQQVAGSNQYYRFKPSLFSDIMQFYKCFPRMSIMLSLTQNWVSRVAIKNALSLNFINNIFILCDTKFVTHVLVLLNTAVELYHYYSIQEYTRIQRHHWKKVIVNTLIHHLYASDRILIYSRNMFLLFLLSRVLQRYANRIQLAGKESNM